MSEPAARRARVCELDAPQLHGDLALLLRILGPRRLAALQESFGGRRVWVPKAGVNVRCSSCRARSECIHRWRAQGHSVRAIARRLGISGKSVYRVLSARPA